MTTTIRRRLFLITMALLSGVTISLAVYLSVSAYQIDSDRPDTNAQAAITQTVTVTQVVTVPQVITVSRVITVPQLITVSRVITVPQVITVSRIVTVPQVITVSQIVTVVVVIPPPEATPPPRLLSLTTNPELIAVNAAFEPLWSDIRDAQAVFFDMHGRYWQGLTIGAVMTVTYPGDQAVPWLDFLGYTPVLTYTVRIDTYMGTAGPGYVAHLQYGGWESAINFGVENRGYDWREVEP